MTYVTGVAGGIAPTNVIRYSHKCIQFYTGRVQASGYQLQKCDSVNRHSVLNAADRHQNADERTDSWGRSREQQHRL
jgi:hypothetical protein